MQTIGEIPFVKPQSNKQLKIRLFVVVLFWLSFCGLFSAWKIVGMTMCNRCDVMNIMWRKTEMEQKSDKERWRDSWGGGGGRRETETACWALEYGFMRRFLFLIFIQPWKSKNKF